MKSRYCSFALLAVMATVASVALAIPEAHQVVYSALDPASWTIAGAALALGPLAAPVTSKTMRALQSAKSKYVSDARAITDKAAAENRDLTDDEQTAFNALSGQIKTANAGIEREQMLIAEESALGSVTMADGTVLVEDNILKDPKRGFAHAGDFLSAVISAGRRGADPDQRLLIGAAAPTTYGQEAVGSDGGFAIPPQFSTDIFTHALGEDSLLPLTDSDTITGNSMVYPKDETTPWGTDGLRAYWQAEASAATQTKPKLSTTTLRLYKLMALVPLTDELLADTNALNSYVPKKVGQSIMWKMNESFLWGLGNGTPQGAFQGNAAVIQAKDSGQATLTLSALNLANMIARLPPGSYRNAVWMMNNNVLPSLFTLTLGNYPIYLPGGAPNVGGIQNNPYGNVLGRPLMVTQHAKSFTSQGDVMLFDPTYYRTITKAGGMQTATSMHIYFDADATAFRTTFRVDGQPKIVNPINPANGSTTLSPFVQLAAR